MKEKTFGERYKQFLGAIEGPSDLASQHEHYRLGTPKRCTLNEEQKKKRGKILQQMAEDYHKRHRYLKRDEAFKEFGQEIENDPVKLRVINALAAMSH
jgi:hypothetical protein